MSLRYIPRKVGEKSSSGGASAAAHGAASISIAAATSSPEDRRLTDSLYGGDLRYRLCQEVVLGIGGTLAEIYRDFCIRVAPVSVEQAREMVERVKGLAVIRGYRGMPRGDCEALARAVQAFSAIAAIDEVAEAEINPMIVRREGEGVVAVDGLVVLRKA